MKKTHPLGFRVEQEVKDALERAAKADGRSVSNLIARILGAWLVEHGFMQPAPPLDVQVQFVNAADGSVTVGPRIRADPTKSGQ